MKRLLLVSLLFNAALAGAVLYLVQRPGSPQSDAAAMTQQTAAPAERNAAALQHALSPAAEPAAPEVQTIAASFDWRAVESEDYKKYIANLRAIGCPEETIRDIITADVNKLFEARRKELNRSTNRFEFWKTGNPFAGMMNPERIEQAQALEKEKRDLLKLLLGVEPEIKPMEAFAGMNPFESMLDFLSSDKQGRVTEIMTKYQAKMAQNLSGGMPDQEDMKKVQNVQKEMEAELATLLTPQELEDYQLRMSQTAMIMRMQLASFEPNEQEFRDIFKVKKEFDDEHGMFGMPPTGKAEREKYDAAKKEMDEQLKGMLGDRFADYERAQDWQYQMLYRVTERNGLSKQTAVQAYDMKKVAEEKAKQVRQDKSLSPEQRDATLAGIRAETENSLKTVLGEPGWNSYQNQAHWLQGISRDPKPNP